VLDRVVGYFSPRAGVERLKARAALTVASGGGYYGGRRDRRSTRNWRIKEASANADILPDLPDLRARSRELVRNNPIAGGALATVVTNVIGDGLVLKPAIDRGAIGIDDAAAESWEAAAKREFALFCRTADFTLHQDFAEMQGLCFRSVLESGDTFVVRRFRKDVGDTYGTKLQFVEAERVCNRDRTGDTPTVIAGIEHDAHGVANGYQIASRHPDDRLMSSGATLTWASVPAWDERSGRPLVLHLFDRLRPDQARGAPYLAPVVELFKTLGDYAEAEVRAAVISAMFTAFVTSAPQDDADAPIIGSTDSASVANPDKEIALEDAGAIVQLNTGEDVKIANPGRPNPVFDAFVTSVLRQVGVALEIPYEVLIKHFESSYSASRAALETAWQFFRKRRTWFARHFCQPVYEWAIEEGVAAGRFDAVMSPASKAAFFIDPIIRHAYFGAEWIGPARINLDPKKESDADLQDVVAGFKTIEQVITERTGGDFETKHRQRVKEETMRKRDGLKAAPPAPPPQPAPGADDPDAADKEEDAEE
jgi:lambda family phage portal protein